MPPDVREWLPENHLAWFVIDAVGEMNLDALYSAYRVDGRARPAYDPAMMVALLLYAYARGTRSSRIIERASGRVTLTPKHAGLARQPSLEAAMIEPCAGTTHRRRSR